MARLAMLVQGLRSHPLHEIYRIDFATASRAGDCFTASPPSQPWVRNDDKNKVVIGRLAWFVGGLRGCPLSCVIEWTLFSFYERGIASRIAKASPLGSR